MEQTYWELQLKKIWSHIVVYAWWYIKHDTDLIRIQYNLRAVISV